MKKRLSLIALLLAIVVAGLNFAAAGGTAASVVEPQSDIAREVIAREKAGYEAWQRKDKAFWADFLADDSTYFGAHSPYLETEPKLNLLPKFDQYVEQFKYNDFQMYNPRVQVYGDVAVLTYNSAVSASVYGQPLNYTGKVTAVYVKQGGKWRIVHSHESTNPRPQ